MPNLVKEVCLLAEGIGWQVKCPAAEVGGVIAVNPADLAHFLGEISNTYDRMGGGFQTKVVWTGVTAPGCKTPSVGDLVHGGLVTAVYGDPNTGEGYWDVACPLE